MKNKKYCKTKLVVRGFDEKDMDKFNESPTCAAEALKKHWV